MTSRNTGQDNGRDGERRTVGSKTRYQVITWYQGKEKEVDIRSLEEEKGRYGSTPRVKEERGVVFRCTTSTM